MGLTTRTIALCLAVSLGTIATSQASADSPVEPTPLSRMAQGLNPANWKMPKFNVPSFKSILPGQDDKQRIVKKKDNLVDDVSKTASNSWQKTKQALNPMNLAPSNLFGGGKPAAEQAEPQQPGFFSSLFMPASARTPSKPATANDFLKLSKPTP